MRMPQRRYLKLAAASQGVAKTWAVALIKAVEAARRRMEEAGASPLEGAVLGLDEWAPLHIHTPQSAHKRTQTHTRARSRLYLDIWPTCFPPSPYLPPPHP